MAEYNFIEGSDKRPSIFEAFPYIEKVHSIAQQVHLKPNSSNTKNSTNGFLVYVLDEDQYRIRSIQNEFFITIAIENEILGYLMAYTRDFLQRLVHQGDMRHEDGIMNCILSHSRSTDNFLFIDQIAISPTSHKKNAGTILMKSIFQKMILKNMTRIYLAIMHAPIRNQASINFMKRLGFMNIAETSNADNLIWGIYYLQLSDR